MSTANRLSKVAKSFGEVKAVDGVDLEIADGEFFAMLGPSGSGKTTVLRLIAGFELPDSGVIEIDGVDVLPKVPLEELLFFIVVPLTVILSYQALLKLTGWQQDGESQ